MGGMILVTVMLDTDDDRIEARQERIDHDDLHHENKGDWHDESTCSA